MCMEGSDLCKELTGHSLQGLFRPGSEPVNGGVVDQSGEVPAAGLEEFPARRHAEDNVEVAGTLLDEVGPDALPCGRTTRLHCFVTNLVYGNNGSRLS